MLSCRPTWIKQPLCISGNSAGQGAEHSAVLGTVPRCDASGVVQYPGLGGQHMWYNSGVEKCPWAWKEAQDVCALKTRHLVHSLHLCRPAELLRGKRKRYKWQSVCAFDAHGPGQVEQGAHFAFCCCLAEGIIFIYVGMDALDPAKWRNAHVGRFAKPCVVCYAACLLIDACNPLPLPSIQPRPSARKFSHCAALFLARDTFTEPC